MKKTDNRIGKKKPFDGPALINIENIPDKEFLDVPFDYPKMPDDNHCHETHKCGNSIHHTYPPKPDKPVVETNLVFGNGIQLNGKIVSVKIDKDSVGYIEVGPAGVSARPLINKVNAMYGSICELQKLIVDLNSEVNKLRGSTTTSKIINQIVENSNSFAIDPVTGNLILKTGNGLASDAEGKIVVDYDESLVINTDGKIGVDYDTQTIDLIDGQIATVFDTWESE